MPIPDFQTIMLPLLNIASDQQERSVREAREQLALLFHLSVEEQTALLPSGRQGIFANRVAWAKVHLQSAGLLASTKRGFFIITKDGIEAINSKPSRIDMRYLERYPKYQEFRDSSKSKTNKETEPPASEQITNQTPQEAIEAAYEKIRYDLANEILRRVKSTSPSFFEKLVVELLVKMGYGGSRKDAGKAIGQAGDEGIDGVINEDRLGLDIVYIQAKKWEGKVGRPEVMKFVGALQGKRARKGVFITTGAFTSDAKEYISHIDPKLVLIDGKQLAELMIDFDLGVSIEDIFQIKRLDSDYFIEE